MKKIFLPLLVFMALLLLVSCNDFVTNIAPLISQVESDRLNQQSQVKFLENGVLARFADTQDNLDVLADGLSDAFFFTFDVPNATFITFQEIDEGNIRIDNNSVGGVLTNLGEMRFFADDMVARMDKITFTDQEIKREALYIGYLMGGLARYYYATYVGLNPTEGGGVIDAGAFIPSSDMYNLAMEKFQLALQNASTTDGGYEARVVNSLMARVELYRENYGQVASFASAGLMQGDPDYSGLHSIEARNYWWVQAGAGRTQWVLDPRFVQYINDDPKEANRLQITSLTGTSGTTYYRQDRYADTDPLPLITWQENELMLAEVEIRNGGGDPLGRINTVRASHGLDPLATADLNTIITERDKELFTTGARLPDERRFGIWHLGAGTWQYFRITEEEINANPNL